MNNKNSKKPMDKKSMIIMWVIIAAIMVFAAAGDSEAIIPAVGTMVLVTVIVLVTAAANKKAAAKNEVKKPSVELNRPFPTPKAAKQPSALLHHSDEAEEAITCHHLTGKEKYIQQLDGYLKAGLIDKAEYKLMKERYQKLDIPEDYH